MLYRVLLICLFLTSCAPKKWIETDLYFGLMKPDGNSITTREWDNFNSTYISAVFADGSTLVKASGSWPNPQSGKMIYEQTNLLICLHKNTKSISARIDTLRKQYQILFKQQSVLRVDKKVKASF